MSYNYCSKNVIRRPHWNDHKGIIWYGNIFTLTLIISRKKRFPFLTYFIINICNKLLPFACEEIICASVNNLKWVFMFYWFFRKEDNSNLFGVTRFEDVFFHCFCNFILF